MNTIKLPRIVLYVFVLAFLVLVYLVMQTLRFYLVPVTFAALLAMLMLPLNRTLEKLNFPRIAAILTTLLIILLIIAAIVIIFSAQVINFAKDLPTIQLQVTEKFKELQNFIERVSGVTIERQMTFIDKETKLVLSSAGQWGTGILAATGGTLAGFGLSIIHFIFFLLYRHRIKEFILGLIHEKNHEMAKKIIGDITKVTRQYLTGVVTVMGILAVLNSIGLLALGIQNAVFFGVLAAVLNVIPYLGVWIGSGLPVLMAVITKDSMLYPAGVLAIFLFTQFIDNNFLTPRITGSQVKINALATIGVIIIGNMVWGVIGMILFIPLLGILKIVFDNVQELKPFSVLIGDDSAPKVSRFGKRLQKARKKEQGKNDREK